MSCGGGGSGSGSGSSDVLPSGVTTPPLSDSPLPITDNELTAETPDIDEADPLLINPAAGESANDGSGITIPSAQAPIVDEGSQVTWPFAPIPSDLELELISFVEMPLASSGRPARWNDMEFTGRRLFVSNEHDGRIYEITDRQVRFWFDVSAAVQSATGRRVNIDNPWHGGVRGFAFHPDFSVNGKLFVSMMQDKPADTSNFSYLSGQFGIGADSLLIEWTVDPQTFEVDMNSYREVFRIGIPEYDHPIKQIAFNPHAQPGEEDYGLLYVAHGDGTAEGSGGSTGQAGDALGKILRINPLQTSTGSYSIPSTNPFVDNPSMADELYSTGHRNPHHLAFLPDGRLIATEAGHDNIEEINLIESGANYGWSQREGAYVHNLSGGLASGISALPADDAGSGNPFPASEFTYPVVQVGHTGELGATFVGQSLGGGFTSDNGSAVDGEFFYVDFVRSGRLYHSSIDSILASRTTGDPSELTMAQTFEASVLFDHDNDTGTAALPTGLPELLQSTGSYDGSGRVDVRIGQGPLGEMYLMNKRNNVIYLVRNSYPPGQSIPDVPTSTELVDDGPTTTLVNFDITVPAYVSNSLQIRLVWGEQDFTASWVVDETWTASADLPTETENNLIVTFNDQNGALILGRYETVFRTGSSASESVQISAAQFNVDDQDVDGDGVSNLQESIDGTNPLVADTFTAPTYTEIQEMVFNPRCDGCHDEFYPSGSLDLTAANSYDELLNQPSSRKEGAILVIPYDPDNSYLLQKMEGAPGIRGGNMSAGPTLNQMVRDWIAAGALNN